jgi:hypothetical protein
MILTILLVLDINLLDGIVLETGEILNSQVQAVSGGLIIPIGGLSGVVI